MLYYLYIDESGDTGKPTINGNKNGNSSRFFTLAGIIVEDRNRESFVNSRQDILKKYFPLGSSISLFSDNEILHYSTMLQGRIPPYDDMSRKKRGIIADEIFNIVNQVDCNLISVTIDLSKHFMYPNPIHPRYYSLLILLERFQAFLEEKNAVGKSIYESFDVKFHKKLDHAHRNLPKIYNIANPTELDRVRKDVVFKTAKDEPILQFSDFISYATWKRSESLGTKSNRWNSIKNRYYNLDHHCYFKRGNIEL